ncbi:thiopurine S-methyltransferase [Leptospira mayottensis]|uniref:Thiopurine S-methyltransferase n=2 Tax=Leptospira mayottensis TaxID=1137606 RepID=A0AA87ML98_9LEPT|nr:thiopurine S-methyltransferase [Leptospira mayottensis]AXR60742.1 thiopurine S-methyltransferase [Leptospira mayottensis]AXR64605.1 thiopurine S-methyltransferase [Leptospira mayottensis]AZQ02826.1 thiopurine S-methyltransferase [Leptospira mayottensis 200901116]EKR98417.1 thiopurine S-methyltransferase, Se/Te detoxification family [Leptospira mayottensis 200901122]TGM95131.1 thiopurine S-methyltransferase [Leptospira mayottensis]
MDANFWHKKWEKNEIAFHESKVNPLLVENIDKLSLAENGRIFLPLCGKTLDISWLLSRGFRVAGAELSKIAIEQLFQELGVEPKISKVAELEHYSAHHLDIFVGDIFHLTAASLGSVDAIYDRASLVALPEDTRKRYVKHLMEITNTAPQLLICYEYDQSKMEGPPFSISSEEVQRHYRNHYRFNLIVSKNVVGGLKGKCEATENLWLLLK